MIRKMFERFLSKKKVENIFDGTDSTFVERKEFFWETMAYDFEYNYENVFKNVGDITFGVEIEFQLPNTEGTDIVEVFKAKGFCKNDSIIQNRNKREYDGWRIMKESTCDWEIISPILYDSRECWEQLNVVCGILRNDLKVTTDDNCAIHVHIGRSGIIRSGEDWINLMKVYRYFEPFTYLFSAGEESTISLVRTKKYAATMRFADKYLWKRGLTQEQVKEKIINDISGAMPMIDSYFPTRLLGLNFSTKTTGYETIEIRTFNGSIDPKVIQTYLIYSIRMITSIRNLDSTKMNFEEIYVDINGKKQISKDYLNCCLEILTDDELEKTMFIQFIKNNDFLVPDVIYEALNGNYTKEEISYFNQI